MQGFPGKILPAGLEIFYGNRRLDRAFPYHPGITFAPRTKMTARCDKRKDVKMEVSDNGGGLGRKDFTGNLEKKSSKRMNIGRYNMEGEEKYY